MQQGYPHLTKENFLSDTDREVNGSTLSLTEHFSPSINAICLSQFWRSSQTGLKQKVLKLKFYLALINTNNLSDFQKSERLITKTAKKLNQSLFQCKNKAKKNFFSEYQDIRFSLKSNKPLRQEKQHSHHRKKCLKVISFCLWIQFCGAGNSSKNT